MKWTKQNREVFYPKLQNFVGISKKDIDSLIELAKKNPRQRARYCTHSLVDDAVHEMVIYHKEGTYIRPHKHIGKTESFHLIDGETDVVFFDDEGKIEHVLSLGVYASGKPFYYRIPESVYHSQIFRKNTLFHEVTKGPFEKDETVFPRWAPEEDKHSLVNEYMTKLSLQVQALL